MRLLFFIQINILFCKSRHIFLSKKGLGNSEGVFFLPWFFRLCDFLIFSTVWFANANFTLKLVFYFSLKSLIFRKIIYFCYYLFKLINFTIPELGIISYHLSITDINGKNEFFVEIGPRKLFFVAFSVAFFVVWIIELAVQMWISKSQNIT